MILPTFELHQPSSLAELRAICTGLETTGESYDFMAGGTDVLPNYKNRINARSHVISLSKLEGCNTIAVDRIGALASLTDIARHPELGRHYPGLVEAAGQVSSPPLRNMGTLGGNLLLDTRCYYLNQSEFWRASKGYCMKADGDVCLVVPQKEICYATYSGDLAPVLLTLDATLHFHDIHGQDEAAERSVPIREFYALDGIQRFHKAPGELLTAISIPENARQLRTGYHKLRVRDTIEYPVMGVAMALSSKAGKIERLELAVTGAEAIPIHYGDLGFTGRQIDDGCADELRAALCSRVQTYRNVPFPPSYRKAMAGEFAGDLLMKLGD